jgi:uncharacterized protein (TIGR03084 family)
MSDLAQVFTDLAAESDELDAMVARLDKAQWNLPTPAPGWTIANQVAHLAFIFHLAGAAAADTEEFQAIVERASKGFDAAVNAAIEEYMDDPAELLQRWRDERDTTVEALSALPPDTIVPWLVRPIPAFVLACAGIMELFGHGQDIADALRVRREYTDRIQHLVGFAILVWDFGYQARGLTPPDTQFRFELTAPSGEVWAFGPEDAEQSVTGPAVDFCLLVTRRRHRDDLKLVATGAEADHWLDIAQAYRGPAGEGRRPGQFADLDGSPPPGAAPAGGGAATFVSGGSAPGAGGLAGDLDVQAVLGPRHGLRRRLPGVADAHHQSGELNLEAAVGGVRGDQVLTEFECHQPVDGDPHLVRDELGVIGLEALVGDAPLGAAHDGAEGVPPVLPVRTGQRETADRGGAEHHRVQVRIGHPVAPVRPSEQRHVRDRVVGLPYAGEVVLQPGEALMHHLADEPAHATEVRVDGHRRAARLSGDPPGGQRLRPFLQQQPGGDVHQHEAYLRIGTAGAHDHVHSARSSRSRAEPVRSQRQPHRRPTGRPLTGPSRPRGLGRS